MISQGLEESEKQTGAATAEKGRDADELGEDRGCYRLAWLLWGRSS